jgi:hypothetical protein
MNLERIKLVRAAIKAAPDGEFSMDKWGGGGGGSCDTQACIAGYTCLVAGHDLGSLQRGEVPEYAANLLELNDEDAWYMFHGKWAKQVLDGGLLGSVSKTDALAYLDRVIETGYVKHKL